MVAKYSSYTQTRDEGNSRLKWKKKIEEVTLEFLIIDEHYWVFQWCDSGF